MTDDAERPHGRSAVFRQDRARVAALLVAGHLTAHGAHRGHAVLVERQIGEGVSGSWRNVSYVASCGIPMMGSGTM